MLGDAGGVAPLRDGGSRLDAGTSADGGLLLPPLLARPVWEASESWDQE